MEQLLTRDYGETLILIWEIIQDPASKPTEAFLIFGIIVIVLIMLMLAVISFVAAKPDEETLVVVRQAPAGGVAQQAQRSSARVMVSHAKRHIPIALVVPGAILAWWLVTGVTTMPTMICESCHFENIHSLAVGPDPHEGTPCVRCHESGGYLAAVTTGVPGRVTHMVAKMVSERAVTPYGYVASASCDSCHGRQVTVTTTNPVKAVRISHKEPLEAGAQCTDCHRVRSGIVGSDTTGMAPCLRCHDNIQASAECSSCHTGDIALAITGRSEPTTETAQRLIPTPDCGGCHDQTTCDSCHGMRLPHSQEFMQYAHARQGVEDLWFNGGRTCAKCHNDENRPCTNCHKAKFLSHGSNFYGTHSQGSSTGIGCDNCHAEMAYRPNRNFCELCHDEL
ncbi:MAG: hypothetical protein ACYC6C_03420 [Coriobacteriia bacterium]